MVLSQPDSSMISGKDLSCPNRIIPQVSGLKWTSRRGRAADWLPGGSRGRPGAAPWARHRAADGVDAATERGCLCLEAGKSDPAVILTPHSMENTAKLEQFSLTFLKKKYMQLAIAIQ